MTNQETKLLTAIKEFLDSHNCAAFVGPLGNGLFAAIGSKKDVMKLMEMKK